MNSCPGDVLGKPSQGCLARVYQSSVPLPELYNDLEALLQQNGYSTLSTSNQPSPGAQRENFLAPPFAQLKMRAYPEPQDDSVYQQLEIFLRQPQTPTTKVEITYVFKNARATNSAAAAVAAESSSRADKQIRKTWEGLPSPTPPRGTAWQWVMQSVATRKGSGIKYQISYYEQATTRTVEGALPLPRGGVIVHVFPDTGFSMKDESGRTVTFATPQAAVGKTLAPGNWTVYPIKAGGIAVYFAESATASGSQPGSAAAAMPATNPQPSSASRPVDLSQLSEGMERAELIHRFGQPEMQMNDGKGGEILWYRSADSKPVEIRIVSGKVASVHPAASR